MFCLYIYGYFHLINAMIPLGFHFGALCHLSIYFCIFIPLSWHWMLCLTFPFGGFCYSHLPLSPDLYKLVSWCLLSPCLPSYNFIVVVSQLDTSSTFSKFDDSCHSLHYYSSLLWGLYRQDRVCASTRYYGRLRIFRLSVSFHSDSKARKGRITGHWRQNPSSW